MELIKGSVSMKPFPTDFKSIDINLQVTGIEIIVATMVKF